jgi:hypothetical protein
MTLKLYRSDLELPSLPSSATTEEIINAYNGFIMAYNFISKNLSLQSNFNCFVAEISFAVSGDPSGEDIQRIEHFLGVKPKWRIILRQTGNGVITDIPDEWNDKVISLKNNGAEAVVVSVFIARE